MHSASVYTDFLYIAIFLVIALIFAIIPLIISHYIVKRSAGIKREETYESGMPPIGPAWVQFSIAYYIFALIFLAFDVDVLYLFPVGLAYGDFHIRDFLEVVIFLGILSLVIVYAWRKGVFEWQRRL